MFRYCNGNKYKLFDDFWALWRKSKSHLFDQKGKNTKLSCVNIKSSIRGNALVFLVVKSNKPSMFFFRATSNRSGGHTNIGGALFN